VPFNIFDQANPDQVALLGNYSATPYTNLTYILRQFEVNASGELFELPAGVVSLAVGASHRKEYSRFADDFIAITRGAGGTCFISQEACATPLVGDMTVKEAYGEIFVPILKDAPFAQTLNLIVGTRHSDYSTFGGTTNSKFAIEWRPIEDVLLRGTVSEVFRAPNLSQLFAGAAGGAPPFADPCIGYQGGHPNACQNVPIGYPGTGLGQTTAVVSGSVAAGVDLKPEHGKSFDFGIVYDPSWIDGLSVNLDVWRIYLNDTIVAPSPQLIANLCYADDNSPFCSLIHRTTLGDVQFINTPTINLGRLDTKGVDIGFKYRLPETPIGNFTFGFDSTYIARYDNDQVPELSTDPVIHVAGHFNIAFGNYARWRALSSINWNLGNWDASWRIKYVGPIAIGNADIRQGQTADAGLPAIEVQRGAQVENNVAVGYNFEAINTRVDFGIDNVFDKQPPLLFNNNVVNANTDVNTYDTVGRFYFARVSVKF
jgi:outer membrane receptor protein involved in Fe transport